MSAQNVEQLSASEREGRQARLEEKMTELQAKLDEALTTTGGGAVATPGQPASGSQGVETPKQPEPAQFEPVASSFNIQGTWQSADGIAYLVTHVGDLVTMQEINPLFGLTAVMEGTIQGNEINVSYETVFGTVGTGILEVSSDGRRITGTFFDLTTGATISTNMFR